MRSAVAVAIVVAEVHTRDAPGGRSGRSAAAPPLLADQEARLRCGSEQRQAAGIRAPAEALDAVRQAGQRAWLTTGGVDNPGLREALVLRGRGIRARTKEGDGPAVGGDGRTGISHRTTGQATRAAA